MRRGAIVAALLLLLSLRSRGQQPASLVEVPVSGQDVTPTATAGGTHAFAFRGSPYCGSDGTVLVVPISQNSVTAPRVVRVDRVGRRTIVDVARITAGATPDLQIVAVGLNRAGDLHAVVDLGDHARRSTRKIVAVSVEGTLLWDRDLDESMIHVKDFAVLASGDILLVGIHPTSRAAASAILHREGGQSAVRTLPGAQGAGHVAVVAGSAGAFVFDDKNDRVIAIGDGNTVARTFPLARTSRHARLIGAQMSGSRLATFYADISQSAPGVRRFVSLQNAADGSALRSLGPFPKMVVCYAAVEQRDEVTMLDVTKAGWRLMRGRY